MIKLTLINPQKESETRPVYVNLNNIAYIANRNTDNYTSIYFVGGNFIVVKEDSGSILELFKK